MKKLLALLLSVMMLLSVCAAAEGRSVTLSGIQVDANGQMLVDLTGIDFVLSGVVNDNGAGARLAIVNNGQTVDYAALTVLADGLALVSSVFSDTYSLNFDLSGLTFDPSMFYAYAGAYMSGEDTAALAELQASAAALVESSMTGAGEITISGTAYDATNIEIDAGQMDEMLDALFKLADDHPELLQQLGVSSASELKAVCDPQLSVSGNLFESETSNLLDVTITLTAAVLAEPATLRVYVETVNGSAEGEETVYIALTGAMGDNNASLVLNIALAADGGEWMLSSLPEDAVNLANVLADQAVMQKIQSEVSACVLRIMSNVMTVVAQNAALAQSVQG